MSKLYPTKSTSPESIKVWEGVKQVANSCPDWIKPKVRQCARDMVRYIMEKRCTV